MADLLPVATRTIGSRTFTISALPTVHGRRLFFRLLKICGPSFTKFLAALEDVTDIRKLDATVIATAAEELIRNLDEQAFEDFYATFANHTQVSTESGGLVPFERVAANVFSADYGSMIKWLAFSLEHNFASFFSGLAVTNPRA
jgi:hypothetical protein